MPHVAVRPAEHEGKVIGTGHCVPLVQRACGAPHTSEWRPGKHVLSADIPTGTAIATFGDNDRYENKTDLSSHAAIYIEHVGGGIRVLDQWVGKPASFRVIRDKNGVGPAVDDASRYHVIESG